MNPQDHLVEKLAFGGDALVRDSQGVVFVAGALPGDRIVLGPVEKRRGTRFASSFKLVSASPHRVDPFCPVYESCGGCSHQHLAYSEQLHQKQQQLRELYCRAGLGSQESFDQLFGTMVQGPQRNYRNRMIWSPTAQGRLGLLSPKSHRVLPLNHCPIAHGGHDEILAHGANSPERVIAFSCSEGVWKSDGSESDLGDLARVTIGSKTLAFPVSGFFQANIEVFARLMVQLNEFLDRAKGRVWPQMDQVPVLDLYAGVGTLSALLPPWAGATGCVEYGTGGETAAKKNLGPRLERYRAQPVERAIKDGLTAAPLTVVDPPRKGLHSSVRKWLVGKRSQIDILVYLSCNPATLMRDLSELSASYAISRIWGADFYPHTPHLEALVVLEPHR